MAVVIYSLCALTSLACVLLLFRAYSQTRAAILFWSGLCFLGLTTSNVLLILDRIVYPDIDLYPARLVAALAGLLLLVFGLVWERE
jgi:FtsH-binding integral membrane protein